MFCEPRKSKRKIIHRRGFPDGNLKIGYAWEPITYKPPRPLANQIEQLKDCHKIFHDNSKLGSKSPRPEYYKMFKFLREGDTLVVTRLDCLESSLEDLIDTVCSIYINKIHLQVLYYNIDTTTDTDGNIFNVFDALMGFMETSGDRN